MRHVAILLGMLALGLLALSGSALASPTAFETYGQPALEAIDAAYQSGEISEAEALLYRFFFVKDQSQLPERFRLSGQPMKCGTPILIEVYSRLADLPGYMKTRIEDLRERPSGLNLTRTTTHFVVHYTNTGPNAVDEAYVDVVAGACETAWTAYHTTLTWDVPPGDGSLGGGTDLIDCYIHVLDVGILGLAEPETEVPGDPPYDFTGFFHVSCDIASTGEKQVTTVHEYLHVVEFGYYGYTTFIWYMENTAMMGEEWAYDTINDYRNYLSGFFSMCHKALKTFNGLFEYAAIVWPMYKAERFDVGIVEDVWNRVQWDGNIWNSFDNALAPYGYNFHSAYAEFMRWCFYTNTRDDGNHFEEGGNWSAVLYPDLTISTYPTGEKHPTVNKKPEPIGTSVMRFNQAAGSNDDLLEIEFNGPTCTLAVQFTAKAEGGNVFTEYTMTLDGNGDGTIQIPNFNTTDYVFMLTSMTRSCTGGAQDYVFSATTSLGGQDVADGLNSGDLIRIYPNRPNPFVSSTTLAYSLPARGAVTVHVLDASGRQVRALFSGEQNAGNYEVIWDRRDDGGREVTSGVYYGLITADGQEVTRQMTVVK